MPDDPEVERARAQLAEALDVVFVRWGEWHLVERARSPTSSATEEARLNVARAEEALLAAQRKLDAATRRREAPRK